MMPCGARRLPVEQHESTPLWIPLQSVLRQSSARSLATSSSFLRTCYSESADVLRTNHNVSILIISALWLPLLESGFIVTVVAKDERKDGRSCLLPSPSDLAAEPFFILAREVREDILRGLGLGPVLDAENLACLLCVVLHEMRRILARSGVAARERA